MSDTRKRTDHALTLLQRVTTPDELLRWENKAAQLIQDCTNEEADEIGQAVLDKMTELGLFTQIDK